MLMLFAYKKGVLRHALALRLLNHNCIVGRAVLEIAMESLMLYRRRFYDDHYIG